MQMRPIIVEKVMDGNEDELKKVEAASMLKFMSTQFDITASQNIIKNEVKRL